MAAYFPIKKIVSGLVVLIVFLTSTLSVSAQTIFGSGNTQSGNISNPIETTFDPLYVDPLFYTEPSVFVNPSNTSVSQTGNVATTTIEATTTQTVTTTANVSTGNVGCPSSIRSVSQFFTWFMCVVIKLLIPVFIAASLGLFVYGVVIYFINADNAEKRRDGSKFMLWGIVALFVMISVWALVGVLANTFGLNYATRPPLPVPKL